MNIDTQADKTENVSAEFITVQRTETFRIQKNDIKTMLDTEYEPKEHSLKTALILFVIVALGFALYLPAFLSQYNLYQ